jgi:hypothetical protein
MESPKARLQPCFAARANYLSLLLTEKAAPAGRSGHPIPSGNSGLNLTDQGYRSWPIKVTAHIHWKESKQERSMEEVDFRDVCFCNERPDGLSSVHRRQPCQVV